MDAGELISKDAKRSVNMLERYFGEQRFNTPQAVINAVGDISHNDYRPCAIFIDNNRQYAVATIKIITLNHDNFVTAALAIYAASKFRMIKYYTPYMKWENIIQWTKKPVIFPLLADWDEFYPDEDYLYHLVVPYKS